MRSTARPPWCLILNDIASLEHIYYLKWLIYNQHLKSMASEYSFLLRVLYGNVLLYCGEGLHGHCKLVNLYLPVSAGLVYRDFIVSALSAVLVTLK